ncbi:HAD family hydrolase [Lacticaseibacillus mingshuiensis]|uniref:HAD family hydrolase n=1 Tax=Lacticaseibacillus mingshuiensis TaxID=2799574 RepID=A0ABW4CE55_9LACO|nr:HAD family hydrolase [Lacticaseibacillus mingshuiensis]
MSPYLIFMDVDNTLIGPSLKPSPANLDAIHRLSQAGHRFFIASGRALFSAQQIANMVGPDLNVIASNGSVTKVDGKVTSVHFDAQTLTDIYNITHDLHLPTFFFSKDRVLYLDQLPADYTEDGKRRVAGEDPDRYIRIDSAEHLRAHQQEITNGIVIEPHDAALLEAGRARLKNVAGLDTSSSFIDNIELTKHGVNKADTIRRVCAQLGHPLDRTMAFGDGNNDLEMLMYVKYGVAMGNAAPNVLEKAPYRTTDVAHDGVASYLNAFFKE